MGPIQASNSRFRVRVSTRVGSGLMLGLCPDLGAFGVKTGLFHRVRASLSYEIRVRVRNRVRNGVRVRARARVRGKCRPDSWCR